MSPLTDAEQQLLLRLARQVLEAGVRGEPLPVLEDPPGALRENCGAFVTLRKGTRLRGCIGYVERLRPLSQTVRECTLAAACRDPRFKPVSANELPDLRLEISVLSPFADITPEEIEIGRHGLLVSRGPLRGLLLPQVAVEWKWDRERFLAETCLKAGLEEDAWRHGARTQAFTAQVFAESSNPVRAFHHAT